LTTNDDAERAHQALDKLLEDAKRQKHTGEVSVVVKLKEGGVADVWLRYERRV
jgi:hypothetical protein